MDARQRPGCYPVPHAKLLVIFIHGFLGGPAQFEHLVRAVNDQGYAAQTLLLPGHGSHVFHFARHRGHEWQAAVDEALRLGLAQYEKVVLMGHSMGGLLSVNASRRVGPAHGLVLWETPLRLRMRLRGTGNDLAVALLPRRLHNPIARAYHEANNVRVLTPLGYLFTLPRMAELPRMMAAAERALAGVKEPVLLIQSGADEIVHPSSIERLEKGLKNAQVTRVALHASWHAYIPEDELALLQDRLINWLKTV